MTQIPQVPLSHVVRPQLPWRPDEAPLTECGRTPDGLQVITRDEARAMIDRHGQQRAAFMLCMTCLDTARRHPADWDHDPAGCVARNTVHNPQGRVRINTELRALALLAVEHRDEFDQLVAGLDAAPSLDDARAARGRAARRRIL